jgi:5-methyltetrahydrofolate--homocysteine methyltransferase
VSLIACPLQAGDDYSYIMAEALADRLAEAFAEKVHELVRRDYWGYAPDEKLSVDDMLKVKYQVRVGPGGKVRHVRFPQMERQV